jgi:hypothetical protein
VIADWIFGEGKHQNNGVLAKLSAENRGLPGFYDLLIFRLYCCADRGSDFFNLQRALSKHGDPQAPTSGPLSAIVIEEMREISQRIFKIFKDQLITPQKNIFDLISSLTLNNVAGMFVPYIDAKIVSGVITEQEINQSFAALKTRMIAFITYQLGNQFVSSGVGCGYYDEVGKADNKGIAQQMTAYLFDVCFSPSGGQNNFEHFVDYLLINLAHTFGNEDGLPYKPHVNEFTKVLDRARLAQYWKTNSATIMALDLPDKEKAVVTGNYIASYKEDLRGTYAVLDELVLTVDREALQSAASPADEC